MSDDKSESGSPDKQATKQADQVASDDPHKTEKLAKAGEDIDPNAGQE